MQRKTYVCYIDYVKAFEKVRRRTQTEIPEMLDKDRIAIDAIVNDRPSCNSDLVVIYVSLLSDLIIEIKHGARQGRSVF